MVSSSITRLLMYCHFNILFHTEIKCGWGVTYITNIPSKSIPEMGLSVYVCTHRGQCGHLFGFQKRRLKMERSETYAHAKFPDSPGKVFFSGKASEGRVCNALALCVYSLSPPQVSIHDLKICKTNPSGLLCDWVGWKVRKWQSWKCWKGCWKK